MTGLRVERRQRSGTSRSCANGCRTATGVLKAAFYVVWMIGRPTFLCPSCAGDWERLWADLLRIEIEPVVRGKRWAKDDRTPRTEAA